jgi:hypothetical protein
LSRVSAS